VFNYRARSGGDDRQAQNYPVYLDATPRHIGGERQWFLCVARGCGRRGAKLYDGSTFAWTPNLLASSLTVSSPFSASKGEKSRLGEPGTDSGCQIGPSTIQRI